MRTLNLNEMDQVSGGVIVASPECFKYASDIHNKLANYISDTYTATCDERKTMEGAVKYFEELIQDAPCNRDELHVAFKGVKIKNFFS